MSDTLEQFRKVEPGVYRGIPGEEYHGIDACSNSRLTDMLDSPEVCRHKIDHGIKPTRAMEFGTGTHAWMFEPDTLDDYFIRPGQCCAETKSGSRCVNAGLFMEDGDWFCGIRGHKPVTPEAVSKIVVTDPDWDKMRLISEKIALHKTAGPLLRMQGENELSVIQTHDATGLPFKLRIDAERSVVGTFVDLKTCKSAKKEQFMRAIWERGYFRQGAAYLTFARKAGLDVKSFVFIAVEKDPPYSVATYRLDDETAREGWRQIEILAGMYRDSLESGKWPGYSDDISAIGIPGYAWYHLPFTGDPEWPGVPDDY